MRRKISGNALGAIGVCLLVFYLVVRMLFIHDLNAALAQAHIHSIGDISGQSVRLSHRLSAMGLLLQAGNAPCDHRGALRAGMGKGGIWLIVTGGFIYLVTCYLPFIEYSPTFFGILGTLILVLFLFIVWNWMKRRPGLEGSARTAGDLRMAGYYFLVVATWGLCGIFGIVTYALKPEMMMERGLQSTAVTLTSHVMVELSLAGYSFSSVCAKRVASTPLRAPDVPKGGLESPTGFPTDLPPVNLSTAQEVSPAHTSLGSSFSRQVARGSRGTDHRFHSLMG